MTALAIFASTFITVAALGFQSQNVNQGHYWAAFFTSFVIGGASLVLYKKLPDADAVQTLAYLAGGATGIVFSMWSHKRTIGRRRRHAGDWPADLDDEHPALHLIREHHEAYQQGKPHIPQPRPEPHP